MREVLFQVSQTGVHHLFNAIEFGSKHIAVFGKSLIDLSARIGQALVVDQKAHQYGKRRQPGRNGRNHHLSEGTRDSTQG